VVLGNALENAMEACERLDGLDMRTISGEVRIVNGQLLIIIKNLFNGLLILTDGSYLSAKNSCAHGLGLRSIQMVVDGCGGFLKTEHSGKRFTLMAAFPNTNSDEPPDVSQGSS
jgi:sensor histidine kinase regulating citrate/malate metabolism